MLPLLFSPRFFPYLCGVLFRCRKMRYSEISKFNVGDLIVPKDSQNGLNEGRSD